VLLLTNLATMNQHRVPLFSRIGEAGVASGDDAQACTPSPDGVHLSTAGVLPDAFARFNARAAGLPRRTFYSLQMFNRNSTTPASRRHAPRLRPGRFGARAYARLSDRLPRVTARAAQLRAPSTDRQHRPRVASAE
jgi:hypothetical protein